MTYTIRIGQLLQKKFRKITRHRFSICAIIELLIHKTRIILAGLSMGEVVNVLVAFAVIVFIFRWATSSVYNLFTSFILFCLLFMAISLFLNTDVCGSRCAGGDSTERRSAADTLGFRPKPVTQDMVQLCRYFFILCKV